MMESYEEAQIGVTLADHSDLHDVKIHEKTLSADCVALMGSTPSFEFGAEIKGTVITAKERESEIKTNSESIATVATLAVASSTSSDKDGVTRDTPINVAELSQDDNFPNDEGSQDDDDNSYQSDDEYDGNDESPECNGNAHNDISQDSDESTSDSDFSDLSGLTDMSGREWKPISERPINWVQKQIHAGANPRELLSQMLPSNAQPLAPGVNDMMLWRILASMLAEPPRRQKLRYINTFEDVIQLIQQSKNIIVLTGAGVSVSCGIPDFRSSDGIYCRLAKDFPNLPDPQAMFDIHYFSRDPRPFYKFAREIYPGQFRPSPCHRFIKLLEQKQKLLRNYTQNIDTLEQVAGIKNVIECHGSFSTASCTKCKVKCTANAIREDIFSQRIPVCRRCQPNVQQSVNASDPVSDADLRQLVENGIMKPDIVFFGEGLPEEFHTVMASDKDECDLLIVIGSSLKVRPVALIPSSIPANIPQILINREQLHHLEFDVELLGDSDVIINQVCHRLGAEWKEICYDAVVLNESRELLPIGEDTIDGSEEDVQQMLDIDTQSVKSSASTDLALRSAGAYSDSGFESSTSSGIVVGKVNTVGASSEANDAIETIKSTILELNHPLATTLQSNDSLSVEYLDEPSNTVDFDNRTFQPFNARVSEQSHPMRYGVNGRHLSIDSSKDSGIQGDSSNSALLSSTVISKLPPPIKHFADSGGTIGIDDISAASTTYADLTSTPATTPSSITTNAAAADGEGNDCQKTTTISTRHSKKFKTAAERLLDGTYYAHDTSSAYIFPGAQVSWWCDGEAGVDENDAIKNLYDDDDIDANGAPLSPLLPPSVEAEVVSEITTTSAFAICAKTPLPAYYNVRDEAKVEADNIESASVTSNTTPYHNSGNHTKSIVVPPALLSSPHKRACKCPHLSSNTKLAVDVANSNSSTDSCECSQPPSKRQRAADNAKALIQNLTDNVAAVTEDIVCAANNNTVDTRSPSSSGDETALPNEAPLLYQQT